MCDVLWNHKETCLHTLCMLSFKVTPLLHSCQIFIPLWENLFPSNSVFSGFFFPLHSQNLSICVCACMCMHLCEDKYARICTSTGVHSSVGGQVCTHLREGGCARICASAGVRASVQAQACMCHGRQQRSEKNSMEPFLSPCLCLTSGAWMQPSGLRTKH